MKQLLLTLAATAFVSIPIIAGDIIYDGISYDVTEGTEVTATGFAGDVNENLVIPATFNVDGTDYTVVAISDEAFKFCNLRSASLPQTLRTIGKSAFAYNMLMSQCSLPDGLQSVGEYAFQRCWSAIMSVKGLSYAGPGAFWECSKMSEVTLAPDAEISENAFMYCTGVKTLVLEGAPKSVGTCAFAFNSLQNLTVKSVTPPVFVPEDVFCYGDNESRDFVWTLDLTDVTLKVPAGAAETYKTDRNWSVFTKVSELQPDVITEFTITPFGYEVTADGEVMIKTFDGSVTECDIPSSVEYAGHNFTVAAIGDNVFANSAVTKAHIPGSVRSIGENSFINCESLTEVTLEEGTETIGKNAFSNIGVSEITLPEKLKQVGKSAFMNCRELQSVTLPGGITLDELVFYNCPLSKITLDGEPASLGSSSMVSRQLREIVFHTDVVPEFSPADVWLIIEGEYNDQVVLLVNSEEMVRKFQAEPAWNAFKAILPVGTDYDADSPYLPENTLVTISDVEGSIGLKAFVPAKDSIRMLTVFDLSCIFWDGNRGMRIKDYSKRISMDNWWDEFNSGDYINGYLIGMMNQEADIFISTSHSVEATPCQDEISPISVTGKQLAEATDNTYQYAYVTMTGKINAASFESEDGNIFQLIDLFNENIMSAKPCERASVRGIYMHEETAYGPVDALIVMDENNFYDKLDGMADINVDERAEGGEIYSVWGVAMGKDADVLAPGIYIRNGNKIVIR